MSHSDTQIAVSSDENQPTLLQLLSNPLILCHTTPYLPVADTLSLAATSKAFRYLLYQTPQVFRYLDLSTTRSAQFDLEGIDHGGETWRNVQLDENLTEDDFYSGPLRGIFSTLRRINILSDVQILVLDGLSVTADLVHDIVTDPSYSVRILSLRECTHLNERKLRGTLKYICRPTRPEATPKLKGLYFFNKKEPSASRPGKTPATGVAPSGLRPGIAVAATWNARSQEALAPTTLVVDEAAPEPWYGLRGPQSRGFRPIDRDWAQTLVDCDGIIAFDAVLCAGPRHMNSRAWGQVDIAALEAASSSAVASVPTWAFAQYSLDGCAGCGSAPEGWTAWGADEVSDSSRPDNTGRRYSDGGCKDSGIGRYPLLSPPPRHSASVKAAMCPAGQALYTRPSSATSGTAQAARFIPRCISCLRDRYCTSCHKWWCESCYLGPYPQGSTAANAQGVHQDAEMHRVSKSCWECGMNCRDCIEDTQLVCSVCGGGYCIIHNEGSGSLHCDCMVSDCQVGLLEEPSFADVFAIGCASRGRHVRELY